MSNRKEASCDAISIPEDVEKLITLIRDRPTLYNFHLKEYHNKDVIEKMWKEVAAKMNVSVADCKSKWQILRNAYARHKREEKKHMSGSEANIWKKKKWYMADKFVFLSDFIGQPKKVTGSLHYADNNQADEVEMETSDIMFTEDSDVQGEDDDLVEKDSGCESMKVLTKKQIESKRIKLSFSLLASEIPVAQTTEFMEDQTFSSSRPTPQDDDDSDLLFFKSLLPDLRRLQRRRQRKFKTGTIKLLYEFLDEQEEDLT